MLADGDLATLAELLSGHRATILLALLGGDALTAGELARRAGVSPSLASSHLARLRDGGLIDYSAHGRERAYRVASPLVAEAIEGLLRIAPSRRATGLREARTGEALRHARTCYDHLAGELGVAISDALTHRGLLRRPGDGDAYTLTDAGAAHLDALGLDVDGLRARRRAFVRPCLDWTERRPHLAGALGAGIADHALAHGWLARRPGSRALRVTEDGARGLRDAYGLNLGAS